ncbi:hypothetical protein TNCV_3640631 [Trichonephila clavipes]|nr:hypothetical protein TNCV_3640631 [Trichonephila clavipes]
MILKEVFLNWIEGELRLTITSALVRLRLLEKGISGLLVKVICLLTAEDVYSCRYSLQSVSSLDGNYSVN